jgi:hypothetical protein
MREQYTRPLPPTGDQRTTPQADWRATSDPDDIVFGAGERHPLLTPVNPALARKRLPMPLPGAKPTRERKPMQDATLFALVACLVGAIGIVYLLQTSEVASLGYRVSELERERADLSSINQQLSYDTAIRQALPAIEERAAVLGMQPITDLIYLDVPLPLDTALPVPTPELPTQESLLDRLTSRLMDASHAADSDATTATPEAGTP